MHMQWGGARGSTFGVHMHGGHVVPTAVAMHMQWGGARGSTFGVHMHVAPTVPTSVAAYACGFGVHMHVAPTAPTFWCAYACGSNGPNGLGCLCMWLQRRYMRRLGWYAYAVRGCICPRVTLDKKVPGPAAMHMPCVAAYARG